MAIPKLASYSLKAAAALPQNKTCWPIDPQRAVLLIHDMQNYFIDFYPQDCELVMTLLTNIRTLKTACRAANIPVIYTAQPGNQTPEDRALLSDFWGPGLAADPRLTDIVAQLQPEVGDIRYTKWRYSAFQRTPLLEFMRQQPAQLQSQPSQSHPSQQLPPQQQPQQQQPQQQQRDQLLICGVYAHIGIMATALEAFMQDIKPFVVADAVADFSAQDQQMALSYIAQRCGQITSLDNVLISLASPPGQHPLSMAVLRRDIANILMLDAEAIDPEENLMYLGLDSIRVMTLLEDWRKRGARINFVDLAESTTLTEWWKLIERSLAPSPAKSPLYSCLDATSEKSTAAELV